MSLAEQIVLGAKQRSAKSLVPDLIPSPKLQFLHCWQGRSIPVSTGEPQSNASSSRIYPITSRSGCIRRAESRGDGGGASTLPRLCGQMRYWHRDGVSGKQKVAAWIGLPPPNDLYSNGANSDCRCVCVCEL